MPSPTRWAKASMPLEKENEALKRKVPEHLKQLQASYEGYVAKKVEEAVSPYRQENDQLKQQLAETKMHISRQNEHFKDMQSMYLSSKLDLQHENSQLSGQLEQMKNNLSAFFNLGRKDSSSYLFHPGVRLRRLLHALHLPAGIDGQQLSAGLLQPQDGRQHSHPSFSSLHYRARL